MTDSRTIPRVQGSTTCELSCYQEGFKLDRVTGSHHIFKKPGITFAIPVHNNRVKAVYVKRMIELIEKENN